MTSFEFPVQGPYAGSHSMARESWGSAERTALVLPMLTPAFRARVRIDGRTRDVVSENSDGKNYRRHSVFIDLRTNLEPFCPLRNTKLNNS